ncbi:FAN1 [Acanthosepion pharaonis]|uniref:Fanconi-associated nuclease n=1 Tax=Acanthosepion pharaonis TaxID=158019 RepID=A0A812BUS6_ACAPH|nr:FAN1 [Sepia pharaonis]
MKTPTPPAVSEELDIPKPAPGENVYPIYSQGVICGYIHSGGNQKTHKIFLNGENQTSSTENKCTKLKTNDSEKKSCPAKFSQKIAAKRTSTQSRCFEMAGKSLQRDKKIKDNQSTITHFFSKKTATHDQNSPNQQTDPTKQEIQIKSSYFSPQQKQNSTNYPLRNLCKRRLSLRKFQDPNMITDLKCASNSEKICEKKAEEIDNKKDYPKKVKLNRKGESSVDEDVETIREDGEVDENKEKVFHMPYYLENFKMIISQVLQDEEYDSLIDNEDRDIVKKFHLLSECSQKLYVRLFARKLTWRMQSKVKYPQIAEDLSSYLKELVDVGFGMSEKHLTDLPEVLALLPVAELKTVAKSFHYNCINFTKSQIADLLINHIKKASTSSMFFALNGQKQAEMAMIDRSKKLLGPCFKLVESVRVIFLRFLALFSLSNTTIDEDTADSISGKLFQMLQVNLGNVVFPQYTVFKKTKIFRQKADFVKYTDVILLESELFSKMEKKDWSAAFDVYVRAKKIYDENTGDSDLTQWDKNLPLFLRHCTSGYVFARILFQGVELLQRQRNYKEACHVLQGLLSQDVYACLHRGRWYERLTLNLDQHLKCPGKALDVIEKAFQDPWVSPSYRLSLFLRAEKIGKAPNSKWHRRFVKMEQILVQKPPEVIITGKTLPHSLPGIKYQFMTEETEGEVTLCNVEQLVLRHYKNSGYPKGIHAEGSIVSTLFFLFFWEIIFMAVPDVFRCTFQTCPLDMMSSEFYTNRKKLVDDRLQQISLASIQELWDIMAVTWNTYFGVNCHINWNNWTSLEEIQGLVSCIGGEILAGILERYAKNPRQTRSGFPDLTLWNVETKQFKISEVKGPGDRLSTKQMLWIDHLLQIGVDAEVCHIKPIGAKKLQSEGIK